MFLLTLLSLTLSTFCSKIHQWVRWSDRGRFPRRRSRRSSIGRCWWNINADSWLTTMMMRWGLVLHRSITGYNPYNMFNITIDYSKNFTTSYLLTIGHMSMFVVKSTVIYISGFGYGSINMIRAGTIRSSALSIRIRYGPCQYDTY